MFAQYVYFITSTYLYIQFKQESFNNSSVKISYATSSTDVL